MATTISVKRAGESYCIELGGRLTAADLKRLERACRYALEHRLLPLELHLEHVRAIDDAARVYLDRLQARGARLFGPPAVGAAADARVRVEEYCRRIRSEYRALPGLCLTKSQIQRRWNLDGPDTDAVLARLVEAGFLRRTSVGYALSRDALARISRGSHDEA